jgi:uncharacterized protein
MKLTLVLTHQCDLACDYCYAGPKRARDMSRAVGERAVERALLALAPGEALHLGLFGGEPLLVWPMARDLIGYAQDAAGQRGVRLTVQLTTNGTHLTPVILDEALALGVQLAVSMDGLPDVHDRFRPFRGGRGSSGAALLAIDLLVASGASFVVNSVVRPETVDRLADGVRFLVERGVTTILPSLDYSAPWSADDADRLKHAVAGLRRVYVEHFPAIQIGWIETKVLLLAGPSLVRPSCGSELEVAVAPSGRLYPCERMVADDATDLGLGHVYEQGPLRVLRKRSAPGVDAACGDCSSATLCANDCACANVGRTGRADLPDGLICALEQACIEEAARALSELSQRPQRRLPVATGRLASEREVLSV